MVKIAGDISYYLPKPSRAAGSSDDEGSDGEDLQTPPTYLFDFDSQVMNQRNLQILERVARLVAKDQNPVSHPITSNAFIY